MANLNNRRSVKRCFFRADSPHITDGLMLGRSLDYMIYAEAWRRVGKPLAASVLPALIVRGHRVTRRRYVATKIVGYANSVYRGAVTYRRVGDIYHCVTHARWQRRRRKRRFASTQTSGESAPMVAPMITDKTAASHRDIEI